MSGAYCELLDTPAGALVGNAASYLLVFFGGGLGATLRHLINVTCARCIGTAFPYGTFIINITGSTVMGLIAVSLPTPRSKALVMGSVRAGLPVI